MPRDSVATLADANPTKVWKDRGKTFGAAVTFVAAFYAVGKPQDDTKTKAVYETVRPAIEITTDRVSVLEGRIAVLEYRLREQASPSTAPSAAPAPWAAPSSFEKEHPAPPGLPHVMVKEAVGATTAPHSFPTPIPTVGKPKSLPAFDRL